MSRLVVVRYRYSGSPSYAALCKAREREEQRTDEQFDLLRREAKVELTNEPTMDGTASAIVLWALWAE